jgi:hypothetical protein
VIRVFALLILSFASELLAAPRWVAVGYGGRRISSSDGVTWEYDQRWSDEAKEDDNVLFNIAYGLGRFIAVGGGARIGHILSTTDGREWKELPQVKGRVATIAFGRDRFVAGHDSELLYSTDGETFRTGEKLPWRGSIHARRSACGDTEAGFRFVIIGDIDLSAEKKRVSWRATTEDGTRYVHIALDTLQALDVAYGSGHFVVVGPNGLIESSHDGQTWVRHNVGIADEFSRLVWTGGRFIVSGGKQTWTSEDALTWKAETQRIPCSVAWAHEPRIQEGPMALGVSWGGNLHTTSNLLDWMKVALPAGPSFESIAYAAD